VTNFTATNGSIKLSWTNTTDDIAKLVLMRSTGAYPSGNPTTDPKDVIATLPATTNSYHDTEVTPGTTYYYALYTADAAGAFSDPASVSFTPNGKNGGSATDSVSASLSFMRALSLGDTGPDVLLLQTVLNNLGFFNSTTTITNVFGAPTQHAMVLFQAAHLLKQSGSLDGPSRVLMNKVVAANPALL